MENTYKRLIRFHYYRVCLEREQNKGKWKIIRPYNIADWLGELDKQGLIQYNVELSDCTANIQKIELDEDRYYTIRFYRLRDTNIPSKIKEGHDAMPIDLEEDEYIGEDMNMLYDRSLGVCMIQRNRMSLSVSRIAEWMTKSCEEGYRVRFLPIYDVKNFGAFVNKKIRTIDFTFGNINEDVEIRSLGEIINGVKKLHGLTGHITISVGRNKSKELDNANSLDLIEELQNNRDVITSAKVKMKDDDKSRTEIVDLFDDMLHDYIPFDIEIKKNLDFNAERVAMLNKYKERVIDIKSALE